MASSLVFVLRSMGVGLFLQAALTIDGLYIQLRIFFLKIRMKEESTKLELKVSRQIAQIYQIMMKFGYPGLMSSQVLQTQSQIEKHLSDYFQPTPKRENLIEWLILTINPLYSQQMHSKGNKKRVILNNLWRLGVMPFSKHTVNLDYEKYLEGLLGYENAVNLIYNLSVLLKDSFYFANAKNDSKFATFLNEIIENYDTLVNVQYDPYKISFPAAYQDLSSGEFEQQYQEIVGPILLKKEKGDIEDAQQGVDYETVFKDFQENKSKFQQVYNSLIIKMKQVIDGHSEMIENWRQVDSIQGRTIKISPNLSKRYREYKEKIKITKILQSKLADEKVRIKSFIQSLNDALCI